MMYIHYLNYLCKLNKNYHMVDMHCFNKINKMTLNNLLHIQMKQILGNILYYKPNIKSMMDHNIIGIRSYNFNINNYLYLQNTHQDIVKRKYFYIRNNQMLKDKINNSQKNISKQHILNKDNKYVKLNQHKFQQGINLSINHYINMYSN